MTHLEPVSIYILVEPNTIVLLLFLTQIDKLRLREQLTHKRIEYSISNDYY